MTARQPAKRPVVRVVIETYPKEGTVAFAVRDLKRAMTKDMIWYESDDDYRRPRVVSVKAVRGGKR